MKILATNWLRISIVVFCLSYPHLPIFVQVSIDYLVSFGGLFFAAIYLRNRWRSSKHTGQFRFYYLRLVAVAVAIVVSFLLLFCGIVLLLR